MTGAAFKLTRELFRLEQRRCIRSNLRALTLERDVAVSLLRVDHATLGLEDLQRLAHHTPRIARLDHTVDETCAHEQQQSEPDAEAFAQDEACFSKQRRK